MLHPRRPFPRRPAVPARFIPILFAALALAPALGGCGGGDGDDAEQAAAGTAAETAARPTASAAPESDCPVRVFDRAAVEFERFAGKLAAGDEVSRTDLTALKDLESYRELFASMPPSTYNPEVMAIVMMYAFAPPSEGYNRAAKRPDLLQNFRYAHAHADSIRGFVDRFRREGLGCRVLARLDGFVDPARLPDPLEIHFLVAAPEIRCHDGQLFVDASLAVAAGPDVLTDLLASVLYRDLMRPEGPEPYDRTGADCLTAVFAKLAHEGIAAWLEDYRNVVFDHEHPLLGQRQRTRLEPHHYALSALEKVNEFLELLLADPQALENRAIIMDELFRGSGAYPVAGFAMADLIVDRRGVDALAACAGSPAEFLRAYQREARSLARDGDSRTGGARSGLDLLIPLKEPECEQLIAMLEEKEGR